MPRAPFNTIPLPPNLVTREQKRRYIRGAIDAHGFNWLVWEVASSGFFTDSYNLFATNVILLSLAYVYWPQDTTSWRKTLINCMTLAGSVVGQLVFGYLADRFGRTRLYGIELVIVVISTITVSSSSAGVGGSIAVLPWLVSMRFVMGVGIGAEYPLSACICTEWASTKSRGRMMAAVFLMQPVGQLISQLVGLFVLLGYGRMYDLRNCTDQKLCAPHVDSIWRWVTGVGAIPALIAIYYRFKIKDPGLYELDVKNEGDRAVRNTEWMFPDSTANIAEAGVEMQGISEDNHAAQISEQSLVPGEEAPVQNVGDPPLPVQFSFADMSEYFWEQGNWRSLLGTSLCWFLLDFAFYGLGLDNPRTLAKLWAESSPSGAHLAPVPSWNPNPAEPNATIYQILEENAKQNLITVSIGSLLGSILLIMVIDYLPRKQFLTYSFVWLAILFFIIGGSFFSVFQTDFHGVSIVLVALCQFSFNFGANTLTFIIPAEIFPTRYRCTCHGISAASGKLGSIIVQAILPHMVFNGISADSPDSNGLGWIFIIFGFIMVLGALSAWGWIPEVQATSRESNSLKLSPKKLEVLGEGLERAKKDGQVIGMRKKFLKAATYLTDGWTDSTTDITPEAQTATTTSPSPQPPPAASPSMREQEASGESS